MAKEKKSAGVRWVEGMQFDGYTGSQHQIKLDAMRSDGSESKGASPMELLLLGLAGCTGMDVIDILKKKRQAVSGLEVRVEGQRAEDYPMVYTNIDVMYIVRGQDISEKAVQDAIQLSETKYCSASIMLGKTAKIETRYEIVPE